MPAVSIFMSFQCSPAMSWKMLHVQHSDPQVPRPAQMGLCEYIARKHRLNHGRRHFYLLGGGNIIFRKEIDNLLADTII